MCVLSIKFITGDSAVRSVCEAQELWGSYMKDVAPFINAADDE